jgi:hypothetical protein
MEVTSKMENKNALATLLIGSLLVAGLLVGLTYAVPDGATVYYVGNSTKDTSTPDSRIDPKGTISTITLNTVQQNMKWKAYVGNVTGTLVLKDSDDYSIYEWSSIGSPTGEVFISRNQSVSWAQLQCANSTRITSEQTYLNMIAASSDSINNTFWNKKHRDFDVDPVGTIQNSTCKSLFTYIRDLPQSATNESALFQEVLLQDNRNLIYAALIDQDRPSYRNDSSEFDFQALVPEDAVTSNPDLRYYFYLEIS